MRLRSNIIRSAALAMGLLAGATGEVVLAQDQSELWGSGVGSASAGGGTAQHGPKEFSSAGIPLGGWVKFLGVGEVFYAGRAQGEIYFADRDEPGGFDWEEAKTACRAKGAGWQLPTRDRLNLLHRNATAIGLSGKGINASSGNWYWSLTQINDEEAIRQRFYDGVQQPLKKHFSARVRCVRVY